MDNPTVYLGKERDAYNVGMYSTGESQTKKLETSTDLCEPLGTGGWRCRTRSLPPAYQDDTRWGDPDPRQGPECVSPNEIGQRPYPSTSSDTGVVRPVRTSGLRNGTPEQCRSTTTKTTLRGDKCVRFTCRSPRARQPDDNTHRWFLKTQSPI